MAEKFEAFDPFWKVFKVVTDEANALRDKYRALTAKKDDLLKVALESGTDEKVNRYAAFVEAEEAKVKAAQERIKEAKATITTYLSGENAEASKEQVEALKTEFLEKRKAAHLTGQNIKALLGNDEAAYKAGVEAYEVKDVGNLGGGQAKGGTGDIVRKRLASATIDGKPFADAKGKVTFTTIASHLKASGNDLRDLAAKAAGVENVRDIPNGTTVSFNVTEGDTTHTVTITTPDNDEAPASE